MLYAAWELGQVRVGHLVVETEVGRPQWWWSCCCGIAGGFTGAWDHARLALAGFMTAHRLCLRQWPEAWERETTAPIAYQIEHLGGDATRARPRR